MARRCPVTGKGVQVGHNVSHSNVKTTLGVYTHLAMMFLGYGLLGGGLFLRT